MVIVRILVYHKDKLILRPSDPVEPEGYFLPILYRHPLRGFEPSGRTPIPPYVKHIKLIKKKQSLL